MPALQGSPGIAGDIGPMEQGRSQYGIRGGAEVFLPVGAAGSAWSWEPALAVEPTEPDTAVSNLSGKHGPAGAAFVPHLAQTTEPKRLPGPLQFVVNLLEFWRLEEEDAVRLLGFAREDADYVASALAGVEQFRGRDVRERIAHLFWIRKTLSALFRDQDTENAWLREPHSWLDDRVPMDLLRGGSMEDLLLVRDYVDTAAGV